MRRSINGWEVIDGWDSPKLARGRVPGTARTLTMRREVLPLFLHYAARYHKVIRPIDRGPLDDWSYSAPRLGHASSTWSDHSSGTAVDLNATREGAQGPARLSWWQRGTRAARMRLLLRHHRVLMWGGADLVGGDYHEPRNYDFMHVAIRPGVSVERVERVIRRKRIGPDGRRRPRRKR